MFGLMMVFLFGMLFVGCTTAEKEKAANAIDKTINIVEIAADVASASGVPFAGAIGAAVPFVGTTILALLGMGKQKRKVSALYKSTACIGEKTTYMANGLKDGTVSISDIINQLPSLVKDISIIVHKAEGVKDAIEKDVNKMQDKGHIKKLT